MKILDLLAKLGILRMGTKKAVWHSGKDMPAEMLTDDVFDAKRDLTTIEDLKAAVGTTSRTEAAAGFCTECGKPLSQGQKFCTSCGAAVEQ